MAPIGRIFSDSTAFVMLAVLHLISRGAVAGEDSSSFLDPSSLKATGATCPLARSSGHIGSGYFLLYTHPTLTGCSPDGSFQPSSTRHVGVQREGEGDVSFFDGRTLYLEVSCGRPGNSSGGWIVNKVQYGNSMNKIQLNWTHSDFSISDTNDLFWCELVDITKADNEVVRLKNLRLFAFADDVPGLGGNFLDSDAICDLNVYSPCPDNKICHLVDGELSCVVPDDEILSPVPGLTRPEFLEKYLCASSPPPIFAADQQDNHEGFLYWSTSQGKSFLQASSANLTLADGTRYRFRDDWGRPQVIGTGGEGEEIARQDDWIENDIHRRLMLSFFPNVDIENPYELQFPRKPFADESGWHLELVWAYGNDMEWIYSNRFNNSTPLRVPSSNHLLYCHEMEIDFYQKDPLPYVYSLSDGGRFSAKHVYLGAFLDRGASVCDMEIYNPCQDQEGRKYCQFKGGKLNCLPTQTTEETTSPVAQSRSGHDVSNVVQEELLCQKPTEDFPEETPPSDIVINWSTDTAFIHATNVSVQYRDGTMLTFEDEYGRDACFYDDGESLRREMFWSEGGIERRIDFSTALMHLKLSPNYYQQYPDYSLEWVRDFESNPLEGIGENILFVCEYVEFDLRSQERWRRLLQEYNNYYSEEYNQVETVVYNVSEPFREEDAFDQVNYTSNYYDDDFLEASPVPTVQPIEARFRAYNFAIAGFFGEEWGKHKDHCALTRYNPCEGQGACRMTNGDVTCMPFDNTVAQSRSAATSVSGIPKLDLGCQPIDVKDDIGENTRDKPEKESVVSSAPAFGRKCPFIVLALLFYVI